MDGQKVYNANLVTERKDLIRTIKNGSMILWKLVMSIKDVGRMVRPLQLFLKVHIASV